MAYSFLEIKSFAGYFSQANTFTLDDGACDELENAVISKDKTITKTRGQYRYYDSSDTLNNLFNYNNTLLAVFSTKLGTFADAGISPNYTGTRSLLTGATVALTSPRVARSAESNKNFYFTTDNGVLKLESVTSSIYTAGVPPALDIRGRFKETDLLPVLEVGIINGDNQVAYRVIFGRRDANDNLLLGAPSEVFSITNAKVSAAWARDGANLVTVTTTAAHGLTSTQSIAVTNSAGSAAGEEVDNGNYTITVTTTTEFTFTSTGALDAGNTLDYTTTKRPRLEWTIPSEITSTADGYFFQLYRSTQSGDDADPPEFNFRLVEERTLTSTEITNGIVFYDDILVDAIVLGNEELYTNPNSREGEAQANDRPPKADDIALYKNHVFYGGCTARHTQILQIVDPTDLANDDHLEVRMGSSSTGTTRRYLARSANSLTVITVGNSTVAATTVTNSGGLLITYTAHGLQADETVFISNVVAGTLATGKYYIVSANANDFKIALTMGGAAIAHAGETDLDFEGVDAPGGTTVAGASWTLTSNVVTVSSTAHGLLAGDRIKVTACAGGTTNVTTGVDYTLTSVTADAFTFAFTGTDDASGNTLTYIPIINFFKVNEATTTSGYSTTVQQTAESIVRAINRDEVGGLYAKYISFPDEAPGKILIFAKTFTDALYFKMNAATPGNAFSPVIPSSFSSGTQVFSRSAVLPNVLFTSKIGEPEAVPVANQYPIGARNKAILRIIPLRDSVIVIKEDGVFRVNGDSNANFTISPIDTTVFCLAANSVAAINNTAIFLSNAGVVQVTDNSVQIISRKIEDPLNAVLGTSTLSAETSGAAFESDRYYLLSTIEPNATTKTRTYLFNVLNETWSTSTKLFNQAVVGPGDKLFLIRDSDIYKERRESTRIDFCDQNYAITVTSVDADLLGGVISSADIAPRDGDAIVKANAFTRIKTVTFLGAASYRLVFEQTTGLVAADSLTLYQAYESTIKMSPIHAGRVGNMKQFAQMLLHTRDESISRLSIQFASTQLGGSEEVIWRTSLVTPSATDTEGFGDEEWGLFGWGEEDNVNLTFNTQPAPIIRVYIPLLAQRVAFLQPILTHNSAGEGINLQSMTLAVRAYQERETR